jgi:predicted RNase H-like HicB family nuclease/uncharacterized protein YuzE
MRIEYSPERDTAIIELVPGVPDVEGEEVSHGVIVHFDKDDRPVRIEIYDNAAEKLAGPFAPTAGAGADDELASAVGRAWIAGYRAGQADGGAEGEAAGTSATEDLSVFTVTYTPTKDGRWKAQCTELPAAVMHAETLTKARDAILTAVSMLIEVRREKAERKARKGAIRERLVPQPESEPAYPEVHEFPYEVAFWILTKKQGYTANQAGEIIAISRGESTGDIQPDYED